jgi:hypothetical protein
MKFVEVEVVPIQSEQIILAACTTQLSTQQPLIWLHRKCDNNMLTLDKHYVVLPDM